MTCYVFRPSCRKNGKRVMRRTFSGRYRIADHLTMTTVSLGVTDKRVAEQRLAEIIQKKEREAAGITPTASVVQVHAKKLTAHVDDYVAHLKGSANDAMYAYNALKQLTRLAVDCGWKSLRDVTAESFTSWRNEARNKKTGKPLGRKTKNDYLAWVKSMYAWLGPALAGPCPLVGIKKISMKGQDKTRRAYNDEEIARLLRHAGEYRLPILTATLTGMRRDEIDSLAWGDVKLDMQPPSMSLRAVTTKNGKVATFELRGNLAEELKKIRPAQAQPSDRVFPQKMPSMERLREIFKAAGIIEDDGQGRKLVMHSTRYTFCTLLHRWNRSEARIMGDMRVTDRKLIDRTYLDQSLLNQMLLDGLCPW